MKIEVAYALRHKQTLLNIEVDDNASVEDAIQQSNILKKYPEINLKKNKVGIFGKITSLDVKLREKDRVEIYRPLIADPKEDHLLRKRCFLLKHHPLIIVKKEDM